MCEKKDIVLSCAFKIIRYLQQKILGYSDVLNFHWAHISLTCDHKDVKNWLRQNAKVHMIEMNESSDKSISSIL